MESKRFRCCLFYCPLWDSLSRIVEAHKVENPTDEEARQLYRIAVLRRRGLRKARALRLKEKDMSVSHSREVGELATVRLHGKPCAPANREILSVASAFL